MAGADDRWLITLADFRHISSRGARRYVSTLVLTAVTALAGTGVGAVFNLGQTNTVNAQSTLKGATGTRNLQITNTGSGGGLAITVGAGKAPIVVNAGAARLRTSTPPKSTVTARPTSPAWWPSSKGVRPSP